MLQENDTAGMKAFCETLHPATVAEALAGELEVEEVWRFLGQAGIRDQAAIFEYLPIEWQVKLIKDTGRPHVARLIEKMSHDDRVDLLRRLSPQAAAGASWAQRLRRRASEMPSAREILARRPAEGRGPAAPARVPGRTCSLPGKPARGLREPG